MTKQEFVEQYAATMLNLFMSGAAYVAEHPHARLTEIVSAGREYVAHLVEGTLAEMESTPESQARLQ